LTAGFTRIAVSGAVTAADDPAQAARELLEIVEEGRMRDER
jgi:thiamine monophosphate synthase